jgi:hypothetical protein
MRRMLDMVRSSSVSATVMQAAARGALAVPGTEMIEILVYLTNHNKVFGQQARMTLAGWELKSSLEAASNPATPPEILDYFIAPENLRPPLLPALLENPSVKQDALTRMAAEGSREVVEAMRKSPRVQSAPDLVRALASNPNSVVYEATPPKLEEPVLPAAYESATEQPIALPESVVADHTEGADILKSTSLEGSVEENAAVAAFFTEHARELSLEGEKPFQPLGGIHESEISSVPTGASDTPVSAEPATSTSATAAAAASTASKAQPGRAAVKKPHPSAETERGSTLQKIAKLDIKGRIQMAMKGNKEERSILIRDSTKLVALAVLESGKITDGEVEKFASQKNVLEAVLRQIPMKRRFMKNYGVVRNLVANPRTPLDVSLGLMKNLLVADLKNLSGNKEVSDTIRKLALKLFKQKSDPTKKSE